MASNNADFDKMVPGVRGSIVQFLIENKSWIKSEGDARAEMRTMSEMELFNAWLCWNGIIGYTDDIVLALDSIRAAVKGDAK